MAPPIIGRLVGDVILTNNTFTSEAFARFTVAHELGHVWDWRMGGVLSMDMARELRTWACTRRAGCVFDVERGREPPPGDPNRVGGIYAGTAFWEDWAESFGAFASPQYIRDHPTWNQLGPIRRAYIELRIREIP
jgi:hypothetical protein